MKRQGYILLLAALLTGCNSEVALPAALQISSPVPTVEMVSILPTPFVFDSEDLKTTVATGAVTGVLLLQTEDWRSTSDRHKNGTRRIVS